MRPGIQTYNTKLSKPPSDYLELSNGLDVLKVEPIVIGRTSASQRKAAPSRLEAHVGWYLFCGAKNSGKANDDQS